MLLLLWSPSRGVRSSLLLLLLLDDSAPTRGDDRGLLLSAAARAPRVVLEHEPPERT